MTTINFSVKVKAGKRTAVEVDVYGTSVNEKTLTLMNGKQVSESVIARGIKEYLCSVLGTMEATT